MSKSLLRATGIAALTGLVATICGSLLLSYHTLRLVAVAAFPNGLSSGLRWKAARDATRDVPLSDADLEERTAHAIAI